MKIRLVLKFEYKRKSDNERELKNELQIIFWF